MKFRPAMAALVCAVPLVHAQESDTAEPVIVTASRVAESADETLAPVTVIDREEIERRQAQSLADLLRALPGVAVDTNGGRGKLTNLMLRGTGATHTLVLVDGIKVASVTNGQVSLQDIPAAQIERIEVVRGPRSSLYGSEAIGGVIQIFTRRAAAGFHPNASVTVGSFGTREVSAGANGTAGESWFSVQAQGVDVDGFNACPGCAPAERDDDAYRSRSASVRAGYRIAPGAEAELHAMRSDSESEYDGAYQNETESLVQVAGARLSAELSPLWHATLTAGRAWDQSDNFKDGLFSTRFDTRRDSASLQNDLSLGDSLISLGFDYQSEHVESTTEYALESRINRGLFAQYRTALGRHDLQLAVRGDDNDQFGYYRTGNLAWGTALDQGLRLTAAYGTAFKAPTFNDLYWPDAGNAELQPERAVSAELGLQTVGAPLGLELRLFRTDVDHLINWACTANCGDTDYYNDVWQPVNVDRARIDGVELAITGTAVNWETRLALTLLDPRDEATGNLLPRRARESLRLDLDRSFDALSVGATLVAEGRRFDDAWNTRELPGYATLELRGAYALTAAWQLGLRLENLLDREYQTAAGFAQPERSAYLTLAYRP